MEEDSTVAEKIQTGIEREGSNLSGVSSKCWWVQMMNNESTGKYREKNKDNSDDDEDDEDNNEDNDHLINNFAVKAEKMQDDASRDADLFNNDNLTVKTLTGLHLTFNLEAGSLLPLAIK